MKIAIMGDSISQGIGSKKINYSDILSNNHEVKNFALTGTTTEYAIEIIDSVLKYEPDVVILFYGNVDALPRVKTNTLIYKKIIPKRYKRLGMLDPRALYTSNKFKKIFQKFDSNLRFRLKNFLINKQGYEQWVCLESFKKNYDIILNKLKKRKIKVITISNVPISEKYFNYATEEYLKYNSVIKELSIRYNAKFIDLYYEFKDFDLEKIFLYDLYHFNLNGYKILSEFIERILSEDSLD